MFNKKTRRNFRQRKQTSSEDEGEQKNNVDEEEKSEAAALKKQLHPIQRRGISCSSKQGQGTPKPRSAVEDDAEEAAFEVNNSSEVLFQVQKKDDLPAWTSNGTEYSASQSTFLGKDYEDDNNNDKDDDGDSGSDGVSSGSDSNHAASKLAISSSAQDIHAAGRRCRVNQVQTEFIPLNREDHSSGDSTSNRYIRGSDEDESDDEPDNHEQRIEFAPRLKTIRKRITERLGSGASLSGSEEEEQNLWEETQLGKGVTGHPGVASPSWSESRTCSSNSRPRQKKRSEGLRIPNIPPPVIVSLVKKKIVETLDSMTEVHRARQAELRKMEGDIECARMSAETLVESSLEKHLTFFRSMAVFVHTLMECLQEKVVEINALELELHVLLSEQWGALLSLRRHRVREQADRLQHLSLSTDEQSGNINTRTGTQWEVETGLKCNEGGGIPEDTEISAVEDEQLQKKKDDIMLRSQAVFSNVHDEFCDVKQILSRFEQWRSSYADSYQSAYISLCLPKLLNPIIRHQLLLWNPLKDDSEAFEKLPWFTAVESFCHSHDHEELEHSDRQTLSAIVEKTVLPKITTYVELVWDPESSHQSMCLFVLCHKLKKDFSIFEGKQSKPVKAFIEAVITRLRSSVDEDVFIPLYPKMVLDDPSSPQCHFRDQQFWKAIQLFVNMGKWDLLLPESTLKELMLDKLLNRYLVITLCSQNLHSNGIQACRKIVDSLPVSWLKGETECLPQLQNFRNHVVQKIHNNFKQHSPVDPNTRSAVVELLQILSTIRCNDSIMAIAQKYHCEDVIYSHQLLNQEMV